MLLKALDLLRTLGWKLISFIFSLIDSLFDILKGLNAFDIVDTVSGDNNFVKFQHGVLAIAITLLGLFAITRFVKKVIDPDEGLSSEGIYKEIAKCGILILMSAFLFIQASNFSIKLSGYTSSIFSSDSGKLSDSMLTMFVDYNEDYEKSDSFDNEDIAKNIKNKSFEKKSMYNDKFKLNGDKEYKYEISWLLAIIVGAFFLYSLFFCGMMLARRQIEFLFLFVISPIVFATSVGNKERRSAVIQQLVSLMLQGAVIMLIISLTAIVMGQINDTQFFKNDVKDVVIKSILYIGCGSFLLTGSQVVNRFIGGNVSANSGREQLMAMMGFGQGMGGIMKTGVMGGLGATMMGLGLGAKTISKASGVGNTALGKVGSAISNFGSKIGSESLGGIGSSLKNVGDYMQASSTYRQAKANNNGGSRLSRFGSGMMNAGASSMASAMGGIGRTMYRRRYRGRND